MADTSKLLPDELVDPAATVSREATQVPLLMIPRKKDTTVTEFYNLEMDTLYSSKLPELEGKLFCYSSSGGWLVTLSEYNELDLLNPLNHHDQYELPDSKSVSNSIPKKFVLSSSPSSTPDCIVMALYECGKLEFCILGKDIVWTRIVSFGRTVPLFDLTCCKGQFYVLGPKNVCVCDIEDPKQARTRIVGPEIPEELRSLEGKRYLVESAGALLMVLYIEQLGINNIDVQGGYNSVSAFRVFEVPFSNNSCWFDSEIKDLGNRTIFLGENHSFSIDASNNFGVKDNCIYFAYDSPCKEEMIEMGIFNMKNGKIERPFNFVSSGSNTHETLIPHHLWIQQGLSV